MVDIRPLCTPPESACSGWKAKATKSICWRAYPGVEALVTLFWTTERAVSKAFIVPAALLNDARRFAIDPFPLRVRRAGYLSQPSTERL